MLENLMTFDRAEDTGTRNLNLPISFFAMALYRDAKGRLIQMPVSVAGDKFTAQLQETERPPA